MWRAVFDISVFTLATMSAGVFYVASQVELMRDWRFVVKYMPVLMAIGIGLSVSNAKAVLEALFGKQSEFVRTPKYGDSTMSVSSAQNKIKRKKSKRNWLPYVEFTFGLYMCLCIVCSLVQGRALLSTPFLVIFAFGFFYVSMMTFHAQHITRRMEQASPKAA